MHFNPKNKESFIQFDSKCIPEFQNFIKICVLYPLAVFTVREMNQIQPDSGVTWCWGKVILS